MSSLTVKFNVGGKMFEVNRSLLLKFDDNMMLRAAAEISDNPSEPVFIDRDGERFAYILDYMRDGKVSLPFSISRGSFLSDLMFYGIKNVTTGSNIVVRGNLVSHTGSFLENPKEQMKLIEDHRRKLDEQKKQWTYKKECRLFAIRCVGEMMSRQGLEKQFAFSTSGLTTTGFQKDSVVLANIRSEEIKLIVREIFEECGFSGIGFLSWPSYVTANGF